MLSRVVRQHFFEALHQNFEAMPAFLDDNQETLQTIPDMRSLISMYAKPEGWKSFGARLTRPLAGHNIFITAIETANHKDQVQKLHILEKTLPTLGIKLGSIAVNGKLAAKSTNACVDAEGYFVDALRQIQNGKPKYNHSRLSIYHDSNNRPVAFRKSYEISSALLLKPVCVENATLPVGTIVTIDDQMNDCQTGFTVAKGSSLATYAISDGCFYVRPERLSPWAHEEKADRALFGVSYDAPSDDYEYFRKRGTMVASVTLMDFVEAAETIMTLCKLV